ncbi:MAG TPA: hypothetical protein VKA44_02015, partial [Gemmatimonadota bacterium]|nr:hypothetical protein [Gemmatimonadota bacterium]
MSESMPPVFEGDGPAGRDGDGDREGWPPGVYGPGGRPDRGGEGDPEGLAARIRDRIADYPDFPRPG